MIDGDVQPFALTLDKFLDHAAKWHPQAQVVSARDGAANTRIGYAGLRERSIKASRVLAGMGIAKGDRVATLAWNSQAHVEAWYAVMGMGAVCHTLNPRLTRAQLSAMVTQSEARILIASGDLAALALDIAREVVSVERVLLIDMAGDLATGEPGVDVAALAPLIDAAEADFVWGEFEETAPSGLCFTSGTTGAPKGVTYTHRSSYLHTLRVLQADVMAFTSRDAVL
ncbi:MAG: AMP-dependent synthetase, partial [Sphingomonadales bacterium]